MELGPRLSRGRGRRWPHSFYFGLMSRISDAGWEGVGEFLLSLSLSELPFQSDTHEASQPQPGCSGGLGTQTMVSFADSHYPTQWWSPHSVHSALFLTRRDALFKGWPVPQPSCWIQTPRAAPEFFPSTQ